MRENFRFNWIGYLCILLSVAMTILMFYETVNASKIKPKLPWTPQIFHQVNPPGGVCSGSTTIVNINYPDTGQAGIPTAFDAVITASTMHNIGSYIGFGVWEEEDRIYLPPNTPSRTYTITLNFPTGIINAPMYVYTTGNNCPVNLSPQISPIIIDIQELDIYIRNQ